MNGTEKMQYYFDLGDAYDYMQDCEIELKKYDLRKSKPSDGEPKKKTDSRGSS